MTTRSTGAVVTAQTIITMLGAQMRRWEEGQISSGDMDALITRARKQLDKACWCDESRCCPMHNRHSSPHQGCILR